MSQSFDRLREAVKAWYREEAARLSASFEAAADLDKLDFDELVRRAQVLLACELAELTEDKGQEVRLAPGSPDYLQLERVAQAMRAKGTEVPEGIRKALGEE